MKFLCLIGLHKWKSDSAVVTNECDIQKPVALVWWTCVHCAKSKLKVIAK